MPTADEFDALYAGKPPWDIDRPQPAFRGYADSHGLLGSVLDVGCGTGEHALMAAALGLDATGVDTSPTAIGLARSKALERGVNAGFLVWDALDLQGLGRQFETVLDCGLYHIFDDEDRSRYVESLSACVVPGGRYMMLCFSDRVPPGFGPRRISEAEIRESFSDGWRIESIEPTVLEVTLTPAGISAWLAIVTRS